MLSEKNVGGGKTEEMIECRGGEVGDVLSFDRENVRGRHINVPMSK